MPFLLLAMPFYSNSQSTKELNTLADSIYSKVDFYTQNIDSNIYLIGQAAPLYQKAKNWNQYINCLNYFSLLYHLKEDFSMYHFYALSALEESSLYLANDDPAFDTARNNMGVYYMHIGDYKRAIQIFTKAINSQPEDKRTFNSCGRIYINIGDCYQSIADYDAAILQLKNALFYLEEVQEDYQYPERASIKYLLGQCYQQKGDIEKAKNHFRSGIKTLDRWGNKPKYGEQIRFDCLLSLAAIASDEEDYMQANQLISEASFIQDKFSLFQDFKTYELNGKIKEKQGLKKEALQFYFKAQEAAQKESDNSFDLYMVANTIADIACLYSELGEPMKAQEYFQRSLYTISAEKLNLDPDINPSNESFAYSFEAVQILGQKAKCIKKEYDKTKNKEFLYTAYTSYQQAILLIQEVRHSIHERGSKEFLSEIFNPIYEGAIASAYELYQLEENNLFIKQAFAFAENIKAINLLESINETSAKGIAGIPDSLLDKESELNIQIAYINRSIAEGKQDKNWSEEKTEKLETELRGYKADYQELIDLFEKNYPRYHKLKFDTKLATIEEIQNDLAHASTCFLEYFFGSKKIYIFSITKDNYQLQELKKEAKINGSITELYNQINIEPSGKTADENFQKFVSSAYTLYDKLIAPIMNPHVNELIIVPDDILGYIPFEVLIQSKPTPDQNSSAYKQLNYLAKDYAISYNYSGTLMQYNKNKKSSHKPRNDFIAFAPSFEGGPIGQRECNDKVLFNLDCVSEEVTDINAIFEGELFMGPQANKSNFEKQAPEYKIIHLATHACVDKSLANNNKIYFTDDYLSNYDLYNLQLKSDLAVLSACNTGFGKLVRGEGLMSLSRGFVHAGCPSLLMSLWSVDDCSTSSLMIDFYKNLNEGLPKNEALAKAKKDFLLSADKLHSHPYFWAPFVQFGSTDAIDLGQPFWYNWRLLPYLLMIGILLIYLIYKRRNART